jgi:hypothetical protein
MLWVVLSTGKQVSLRRHVQKTPLRLGNVRELWGFAGRDAVSLQVFRLVVTPLRWWGGLRCSPPGGRWCALRVTRRPRHRRPLRLA